MSGFPDMMRTVHRQVTLLYDFAITPDAFDASYREQNRALEIILEEILRSISENGVLANLNKDRWKKHVFDRVGTLPGNAHRDKVIRLLETLHDRNRLVRHTKAYPGPPPTDSQWLNMALASHAVSPFDAIIVSNAVLSEHDILCPEVVELSRGLDCELWQSHRRSVEVVQSVDEYREVLTPVLRYAKRLDMVDPFLNCSTSRFFNTVRLCYELLGQRRQAPLAGLIRIHTGDPDAPTEGKWRQSVQDRLDIWENALKPLVAREPHHRIHVFLWRQKKAHTSEEVTQRFHDRYVLTDQCGVSVPGGLDCWNGALSKTTWLLLNNDVRSSKLQEYDPLTSPHEPLGDRLVEWPSPLPPRWR